MIENAHIGQKEHCRLYSVHKLIVLLSPACRRVFFVFMHTTVVLNIFVWIFFSLKNGKTFHSVSMFPQTSIF